MFGPLVPAAFLATRVASTRLLYHDVVLLTLALALTSVNFALYGYQQAVFNALFGGMAVHVIFESKNSIAS